MLICFDRNGKPSIALDDPRMNNMPMGVSGDAEDTDVGQPATSTNMELPTSTNERMPTATSTMDVSKVLPQLRTAATKRKQADEQEEPSKKAKPEETTQAKVSLSTGTPLLIC
jgi:hypothetical protein